MRATEWSQLFASLGRLFQILRLHSVLVTCICICTWHAHCSSLTASHWLSTAGLAISGHGLSTMPPPTRALDPLLNYGANIHFYMYKTCLGFVGKASLIHVITSERIRPSTHFITCTYCHQEVVVFRYCLVGYVNTYVAAIYPPLCTCT